PASGKSLQAARGQPAAYPVTPPQKTSNLMKSNGFFKPLGQSSGYPAQSAYNMSKFAVRGLTECLWSELEGTGVRAVCVHPGGIRTNIHKAARHCQAAGSEDRAFAELAEKMLVTPPEVCAADILKGLRNGDRRIITGSRSSTIFWMSRLLPDVYPGLLRLLG
ncbi:MAG: SDR family NAD(P)-dependent oxidoreductase, partial [Dechloromonas sp.]|nr:SDR family NAD(P)-dependent oxidoreductase [Dechloromonas sp.]